MRATCDTYGRAIPSAPGPGGAARWAACPIGVRIRAMVKEGAVDPFDALLKGGAGEHESQADPVADKTDDAGGAA